MGFKIRSPVVWQKRNTLTIPPRSTQEKARRGGTYRHFAEWFTDCPVGYVRLVDCPEIQTPVNRIADLVSSMTIQLMENTPLGDVRVKNELSRMVDVTPNKLCNHKEFYYAIVKNMLLHGNGNSIIYPLHEQGLLRDMQPFDMTITNILPGATDYDYRVLYKNREYKPDEILHFRTNPDPDKPWIGGGYRVLLRDIADNLAQSQKTKGQFMKSPKPTLIISMDALTDDMDSAEGRQKLASKYLAETDGGMPWFIPGDLIDVKEIRPLSLTDIAINESVTLDKKTAAAIIGVPPFMVGVGEYNRDEYNSFINTIVHSIAKIIQQEMSRKLLISDNWYFRFNHRSLLAYSYEELVNGGGALVDRMAMDRNEYRDSLGLSPEDRYSDLLGLENYLPIELLGLQKKLNGMGGQESIGDETTTGQTINAQQMTAFNNIIEKVIDGTYSKEAAMKWIALAIPSVSPEDAEELIDGVNPQAGGDTE